MSSEENPPISVEASDDNSGMVSTEEYEKMLRKSMENEVNFEEYFLNPLVTDTNSLLGDDPIDKMLKALEEQGGGSIADSSLTMTPEQQEVLKILGITPSSDPKAIPPRVQTSSGDPFYYEGKLVRYTRYFVSNVEVTQNQSMTGYQDYYEEGRLVAFSIACNDSDMIPIIFVENSAGSKDIINGLSYKEAVTYGRGMTYGEATSVVGFREGATSRDVSGQRHTIFPYVVRYKDTFTGDDTEYENIKGSIHDKYYVMNYEPEMYIPYRRLYIDVYNGSAGGNRLIHRMEIKRLVYISEDEIAKLNDRDSEFTKLNKALQSIYEKISGKPKDVAEGMPVVATNEIPPQMVANEADQTVAAYARNIGKPNIFNDLVGFLYNKINPNKGTTVSFAKEIGQKKKEGIIYFEDAKAMKNLASLKAKIGKGKTAAEEAIENIIVEEGAHIDDDDDDDIMEMKMY